jgi:NADPH:quinone reductase-like Zn-dependent oxidoreductase
MRAAVYTRYGPPEVVRITDVPKPVPLPDEVLVRVHATTVTSADRRMRSLDMPRGFGLLSRAFVGVTGPRKRVLGTELSGVVEAVGDGVTGFSAGDPVLAFCGARMGCHAEYRCVPADGPIAAKPANLSHGEAASLSFGGTTALDFFRRGKLRAGERVLVNGASGGVGTAAVQLARYFGAEVTGICSAANAELVLSLGAARVIDYTVEDFPRNGETYDVIVDTVGNAPFSRSRGSLAEGGRLLMVLGSLGEILASPWAALTGSRRIVAGPAAERPEDVRFLAGLAASGAFRAVIDRDFPLERIVDAHRYVDTGRKRGSVIVTLEAPLTPGRTRTT